MEPTKSDYDQLSVLLDQLYAKLTNQPCPKGHEAQKTRRKTRAQIAAAKVVDFAAYRRSVA